MLQNAPFKIFPAEVCPQTPLANAWLRHASQAASRHATRPAPQKFSPPPLANHTYYHGLLLTSSTKKLI